MIKIKIEINFDERSVHTHECTIFRERILRSISSSYHVSSVNEEILPSSVQDPSI